MLIKEGSREENNSSNVYIKINLLDSLQKQSLQKVLYGHLLLEKPVASQTRKLEALEREGTMMHPLPKTEGLGGSVTAASPY